MLSLFSSIFYIFAHNVIFTLRYLNPLYTKFSSIEFLNKLFSNNCSCFSLPHLNGLQRHFVYYYLNLLMLIGAMSATISLINLINTLSLPKIFNILCCDSSMSLCNLIKHPYHSSQGKYPYFFNHFKGLMSHKFSNLQRVNPFIPF